MPKIYKRHALSACLGVAFLAQSQFVSAIGLMQAYDAALQNDPTYRSAIFENQAGQENKTLGRSNLLPTAQINYSAGKNRAELTQPVNLGGGVVVPYTTYPDYTSSDGNLNVRQVLFSLDAFARYKQGVAQSNYSTAVFSSRSQELIVRLASAYTDAKYNEDQVALLEAQRDAFTEQKLVNERMFAKGEGTKTDVLETQAKLDLAVSELIEAKDNLATARNTLAAIIGQDVTSLSGLTDDFKMMILSPSSFDDWTALANQNNAEIIAGQFAVQVAEQEVKKSWAGHTPRLDLQASLDRSRSNSLTNLNQDSTTKSVGVQLVIPLYSGGAVNAQTNQAVANREKSKSDLEATTKKVMVELHKQYSAVLSSSAKVDALMKSVSSATELVQATKQSVKGGVRINLDVLNAQQQLVQAKRDLAQARYNYLLSYLKLRNAAGVLNGDDLKTISSYFVAGN